MTLRIRSNCYDRDKTHDTSGCKVIANEQHMRANKPLNEMPFPQVIKKRETRAQLENRERRRLDMAAADVSIYLLPAYPLTNFFR